MGRPSNLPPKANPPGKQPTQERVLPKEMEAKIKGFIAKDDPVTLVAVANEIGRQLVAEKLTTSQIRNVFGAVRKIQLGWQNAPEQSFREAVLLIPKLGYFAKRAQERQKTSGMDILEKVLVPALQTVYADTASPQASDIVKERFMRFADFFEAIVAYHKKHGGREN